MFYRDTQALVIHVAWGTCIRGDIVIHISFAFVGQHRFFVFLNTTEFLGVVLELYESPRNPTCRHIFFCRF